VTALSCSIFLAALAAAGCAVGMIRADTRGKHALAASFAGLTAASFAVAAILSALNRHPAESAAYAAMAAVYFWLWRWNRPRRRRSLKALGHKAKARVADMLRNMPKPGPVPRPVPQGAP
jgi:hypothetical protein